MNKIGGVSFFKTIALLENIVNKKERLECLRLMRIAQTRVPGILHTSKNF